MSADPVPRLLEPRVRLLLDGLAAINIEGARGVGKTWLAQQLGRTFVPVDDPDEHAQLIALGARALDQPTPVVLDEWQRLPELWDRVRRAVDADATPGRFILTGSATPAQAPVHTGAGRIATVRLRPLSLVERGAAAPTVSLKTLHDGLGQAAVEGSTDKDISYYVDEILRSGFPGIRTLPQPAREAQLDSYLAATVQHDLADGSQAPHTLRDWLRAYAAATAQVITQSAIAEKTRPAGQTPLADSTARRHRELLLRTWLIEPVPGWAWSENELTRGRGIDKHHLCDPALAARLLGLGSAGILGVGRPRIESLRGAHRHGRMLGPLFESLVTQSVQVYASLIGASVFHLRTKGGAQEIDLILEWPDRTVVAIEVKAAPTPRPGDTKHLLWLRRRIGERLADAVVVTTGRYAYRDEDGIAVVPAVLLGP